MWLLKNHTILGSLFLVAWTRISEVYFFFNHSDYTLSLLLSKRKRRMIIGGWRQLQKQHRAGITLGRGRCISFLWFLVLYTFRETSPVMNYRNDPWTYSLFLFFLVDQYNLQENKGVYNLWRISTSLRFFFFFWQNVPQHTTDTIRKECLGSILNLYSTYLGIFFLLF